MSSVQQAAGGLRSLRVEALLAVEAGVTTVEEAHMKTYGEERTGRSLLSPST